MIAHPPRRLSANGEHGFPPAHPSGRVRVFVNGDMLRSVLAYDIDAGWVEIIAHDDDGNLMCVDGSWNIARHYGAVRVAMPDAQ